MDCSICSTMPFTLRPPRNTICVACFEGAKTILAFINNQETHHGPTDKIITGSPPLFSKGEAFGNVRKWINSIKTIEEEANKKLNFLSGFGVAFKEQLHTDILLKPGDNGPSIPAHRAILAARSEIFKNMLDSDGCKAAPKDTISLPELNNQQLNSLLEFLYTGTLSIDILNNHVYSLFLAADKYGISYLHDFCETHMLGSLSLTNALDVFEISDICSNKTLKERALGFIVRNMEEILFSSKYDEFVSKNPHLCVQISRAFFMDSKSKRTSSI